MRVPPSCRSLSSPRVLRPAAISFFVMALLGLALAKPNHVAASMVVESTFDTDGDGWQLASVAGDGSTNYFAPVDYVPSGGNPGGYLAADDLDFDSTFFVAPPKFLGDISWAYGGMLAYDDIDLSGPLNAPKLTRSAFGLIGAGNILVYFADPAIPNWRRRRVPLTESIEWLSFVTFTVPTQQEFLAVLGNLESMGIEGETFANTTFDRTGLDNVRLVGVPEPAAVSSCGVGLLTLFVASSRRRRRPVSSS